MTQKPLLKISVTTTAEAEEAVGLVLERIFGQTPAVYANEKTKTSVVSVYETNFSVWTQANRRALTRELKNIKPAGLHLGGCKITTRRLARENWAESWKRHFKPIEIGAALLLRPSWIKRKPKPSQAVIVLDPGLSFGTGHHATTGFCLAELVRHRFGFRVSGFKLNAPHQNSKFKIGHSNLSFLDIGTGSGILAIAAAKLGYAPVSAFDFDPESVRVAKANARQNRVQHRVALGRKDLTKLPQESARKYDFICANLISTLLLAERERIVNRLRPGGVLVLAGILKREFEAVRQAYEQAGLRFVTGRNEKEWRSGTFFLPRTNS